jgi:hypothetical protein
MSTQVECRSSATPSADLLPWADPYILQLFEEAELVTRENPAGPTDGASPLCVRPSEAAEIEAVFTRDAWRITSPRRSAIARRRRTESAPQLAPC